MIDFEKKSSYGVEDLRGIVRILRAPGGCPWDREQDHHSIRRNLLEEAYEAAEAIDEGNPEHLQEELGDVLLQVVFHARMEGGAGASIWTMWPTASVKLIYRHPHVFGDVTRLRQWRGAPELGGAQKEEKHQTTAADSVDSVARSLPGLWRAERSRRRPPRWASTGRTSRARWKSCAREAGELEDGCREDTNVAEELGDLLFAAVNVARFVKVDPEDALSVACDKFARRFRQVEASAAARGRLWMR